MKKLYKKNVKKRKTSFKSSKRKNLKKKNNYKYIYKIVKFVSLFLIMYFHIFYNNYSKALLDYYYTNRLKDITRRGKHYDESNLITFENKLNWLAIHDVKKLKGKCADKILLHEYSKRILKKDICNKIIKVYDDPYQINIDELPDQFVLKTNHGCGFNIIVSNKSLLNITEAKNTLSHWLQIDFSKKSTEFHYSFIKRKAFAEEYIGNNLNNYKFFCYNGIPRFIYILKKVEGKSYNTYFDIEWNRLDFNCMEPPNPTEIYPKPKTFELMKKYASKLSSPFKFVRVDFYEYNNEVRLGELTFLPYAGYLNCDKKEHNIELGKYLKLF